MLADLRGNCPRCGTKNAFFNARDVQAYEQRGFLWDILAFCAVCSRGIVVTVYTPENLHSLDRLPDHVRYVGVAPEPKSTDAPQHTPGNIAHFFKQARDNLNSGNYDAAGSMYRKSLDTAMKIKYPQHKNKRLLDMIDKAAEEGNLTTELAEWSHQIRLYGNDALHEEEPFSKDEAEKMDTFTYLLLSYVFQLPGMIREAKEPSN